MKKLICIMSLVFLFASGCTSNNELGQTSDAESQGTGAASDYAPVTYQKLTDGSVKENDTFSITATFDDSKMRVFDTDRKMHQAIAYVGDKTVFFYFQTAAFASEDEADSFNFEAIDSLAGKEGTFKFTYMGLLKGGTVPVAMLQEVEVDGVTYTKNDIGDITKIQVITKIDTLDTVIYMLPKYEEYLYAAARISNTGTVAVELSEYDCSLDIEDSDGGFVYHLDHVTVAPSVLMPGETGYIVGSDLNTQVNQDECKKLVVNLSYKSAYAVSQTLEIEDVSFAKYSGYFYSTPGRVTNDRQYDIKNVTPIIAIFGKSGNFLGVNIDNSIDLSADSKMGFSGESSDPIPLSSFSEDDVGSIVAVGSFYTELSISK
jgi:hypothetical protein